MDLKECQTEVAGQNVKGEVKNRRPVAMSSKEVAEQDVKDEVKNRSPVAMNSTEVAEQSVEVEGKNMTLFAMSSTGRGARDATWKKSTASVLEQMELGEKDGETSVSEQMELREKDGDILKDQGPARTILEWEPQLSAGGIIGNLQEYVKRMMLDLQELGNNVVLARWQRMSCMSCSQDGNS